MNDQYLKYGFYVNGIIPVVTEAQIMRPGFVRATKNYSASLGVPWRNWHGFVTDFYRDVPVIFINDRMQEVHLNMEVFETPSIDYWFRDFVKPVPDDVNPIVRREAKGRVIILATLMRAHSRIHKKQ